MSTALAIILVLIIAMSWGVAPITPEHSVRMIALCFVGALALARVNAGWAWPVTLDTIRKFIFSFVFRPATRLRFDLKEK